MNTFQMCRQVVNFLTGDCSYSALISGIEQRVHQNVRIGLEKQVGSYRLKWGMVQDVNQKDVRCTHSVARVRQLDCTLQTSRLDRGINCK
jgi:hypothetical protein